MLILGLIGMYFDAVVVFVTSQILLFRLALAILWCIQNGVPHSEFLLRDFSRYQDLTSAEIYIVPPNIYSSSIFSRLLHHQIYVLGLPHYTGCLKTICQTSNQHFFRTKLHSKQKPFIFGTLSKGDLCMDNQFLDCLPYTASTASNLKDAIFLMIQ